jgi:hypothetical protein
VATETRGCIACNVVVRLPALLCTDCGQNGDLQHNDDVLVLLRQDGPVEVTEELLDEMLDDLAVGDYTATGADILMWMKGALVPPVVPKYEDIVD